MLYDHTHSYQTAFVLAGCPPVLAALAMCVIHRIAVPEPEAAQQRKMSAALADGHEHHEQVSGTECRQVSGTECGQGSRTECGQGSRTECGQGSRTECGQGNRTECRQVSRTECRQGSRTECGQTTGEMITPVRQVISVTIINVITLNESSRIVVWLACLWLVIRFGARTLCRCTNKKIACSGDGQFLK